LTEQIASMPRPPQRWTADDLHEVVVATAILSVSPLPRVWFPRECSSSDEMENWCD
jgi:hypothetical protein